MNPDKNRIIDIRQEYLVPFHIRFFGLLLLVLGILGFSISLVVLISSGSSDWLLWASLPFAVLGAFLFYSHYRMQIDILNRSYTIVTRMPFLKSGKPVQFNFITNIFVNAVKETTTYTTRSALRYDITHQLYKAFIKFDNGEKVHVDTDKDKSKLEGRVNEYIHILGDLYQPE